MNLFLRKVNIVFVFLLFVLSFKEVSAQSSYVDCNGRLQTKGNKIVGSHGNPVQLRGMSMFWSQWQGKYYTKGTVQWLRDDWKCTVVRAAMGVDANIDGYLKNPDLEKQKIKTVVQACIDLGIYVIIDWHSHYAENQKADAIKFFKEMATLYGSYPNVMYEIYNEPLDGTSWSSTIKPYSIDVIKAIRDIDPDNLIIVGTRKWSQRVDEAANDPISDVNVAYTLHFYSATTSHQLELRNIAQTAITKGIPLFVTEFGTCEASGNGAINEQATKDWFTFLDNNKISWCNWAVSDKSEAASALPTNASTSGGWPVSSLTTSGKIIRTELLAKYVAPNCTNTGGNTGGGTNPIPYNGTRISIPGRVEAEQYDKGGSGVSFFDSDATNQGNAFRTDGVDIEKTGDVDGEFNIGYVAANEWLEYAINCTKTSNYVIKVRVASNETTGKFHLENDGKDVTGTVSVASTGDWQKWTTITLPVVSITKGDHSLRIVFDGPNVNVNYILFEDSVTTGFESYDSNNSYLVYPNPFKQGLSLGSDKNLSYQILAIDGSLLESGNCESKCKIAENLAKGIYILSLHSDHEVYTKRIVKD